MRSILVAPSRAHRLPVSEALQQAVGLAEILLHLLAAVEDGAVAAAAQHVLMQAALAALALRPQRGERLLQLIHCRQGLSIYLYLLRLNGWLPSPIAISVSVLCKCWGRNRTSSLMMQDCCSAPSAPKHLSSCHLCHCADKSDMLTLCRQCSQRSVVPGFSGVRHPRQDSRTCWHSTLENAS